MVWLGSRKLCNLLLKSLYFHCFASHISTYFYCPFSHHNQQPPDPADTSCRQPSIPDIDPGFHRIKHPTNSNPSVPDPMPQIAIPYLATRHLTGSSSRPGAGRVPISFGETFHISYVLGSKEWGVGFTLNRRKIHCLKKVWRLVQARIKPIAMQQVLTKK